MNNSELSRYCHASDERRETSDKLKDREEFQRGGENFQRRKGGGQVPSLLADRARSECARSMRAVEGNLGHSPKWR